MSSSINNQLDFELEFYANRIASLDAFGEDYWKIRENICSNCDEIIEIIKYYVEWKNDHCDYVYFVEQYEAKKGIITKQDLEIKKLKEENEKLSRNLIAADKGIIYGNKRNKKLEEENEKLKKELKKE